MTDEEPTAGYMFPAGAGAYLTAAIRHLRPTGGWPTGTDEPDDDDDPPDTADTHDYDEEL